MEGDIGTGNSYYYEYYDDNSYHTIPAAKMTKAVTNYQYEIKKERWKKKYISIETNISKYNLQWSRWIMPYKKGAAQYVSDTLKKGENIKLYQ